jgi:hypothetical protein
MLDVVKLTLNEITKIFFTTKRIQAHPPPQKKHQKKQSYVDSCPLYSNLQF